VQPTGGKSADSRKQTGKINLNREKNISKKSTCDVKIDGVISAEVGGCQRARKKEN
jgi:hypothetical protein